jgi:hypothetical protein
MGRALRELQHHDTQNVAEILDQHATFELEAIDRMYVNGYMPSLQTGAGFVYFLKTQLGVRVPSTIRRFKTPSLRASADVRGCRCADVALSIYV